MTETWMAYPELRDPFDESPIHPPGCATVLYRGHKTILSHPGPEDGERLLIRPEDLKKINGFEVKPEGACYEEVCIPLNDRLLMERDGERWFDVTAFAELLDQPFVADAETRVWSFGEIPARRESTLLDAMAPDIEVTDRNGKVIRLADLKGKKALIVTWSSW